MQAKLALIREALAIATKHYADFKDKCPEDIRQCHEVDEIEMGLEWTTRKVNALRVLVEMHQNRKPFENG